MMGTELVRPCIKEENMEIPSIPPGFEAFTTFSLKKVEDTEMVASCSTSTSAFGSRIVKVEPVFTSVDEATITRSLRRKPWINYDRCDDRSENESDSEQNLSLPKGVVRGCAECNDCQKVTARWHPEDACRPNLEEVPVFYPNEQEFEDTIQYIASIRSKAEKYGICRIVPPPSWKPPCPLKDKYKWERSKFPTRVQRVDKLQNRDSANKVLKANNKRRKRRRCMKSGLDCGTGAADCFASGAGGAYPVDNFGFEPGPEFTLDSFQKYAHDFKAQYFRNIVSVSEPGGIQMTEQRQPTVEDIEGEYWRMVEKPTEEIEVLYGADLETGVFGSGFPKLSHQSGSLSDEKYVKSGWNLNNFPRLPGSVLSYESSDISGVLVPWLYVGMCFSSFCWHVEDHHLYSLNYMHWGAPKMWYGVPGEDAPKLEAAMRKHLPDLFKDQPDLLHKLVTQLSPSILKVEGVPVYRCVQNAGEFVLTFPRAYHSGFNCGFNCAEAVNVAPVDWLPHGQTAIELYREQGRKTSISHDKLLLGAARDAVRAHWELNLLRKNTSNNLRWKDVCGKDGVLSKTLKTRVEMERVRREFLCHSSRAVKMESNFDATDERECSVCLFDLHLSATGCSCSPDKYACLNHANQLCSCSWSAKYFLFRYEISELFVLVEALEGKLSAVYRWARLDLGLALSSHVSKENKQVREVVANPPHYSSEPAVREISSHTSVISHKATEGKKAYFEDIPNSSGSTDGASSNEKFVPIQVVLALEAVKASSALPKSLNEVKQSNSCSPVKKKEEASRLVLKIKTPPICQLSQEDTSFVYSPEEKVEEKKPLSLGNSDIILLSDDEGEESKPPTSETLTSEKQLKISQQTMDSVTVATSNCAEDPLSCKPLNNAAAMCEEVLKASSDEINSSSTSNYMKGGVHEKDEILIGSTPLNVSSPAVSPDTVSTKNGEDKSNDRVIGDCSLKIVERDAQPPQSRCSEIPNNEDKQKLGLNGIMRLADDARSALEASSSGQNNLDKYYRQKGPRIAKVVRRINCNVEPLEYGAVQSGKSWCDSRAIFPKGFKSRVRYINVLDPTNLCHYVSEVLDAGHDRPLFMVSVEQCPSEVFIHLSAAKCWEMVRDRVNQEINKQHKLGRIKLPPLQPPGSLDGMEMFGFSSPEIVQGIQALDRNQVCTEYWKSRPLMQQSGNIISSTTTTTRNNNDDKEEEEAGKNCTSADNTVLAGLFKKANPEELHVLHKMLLSDRNPSTTDQQRQDLVTRLLDQEIRKLVR